MASPISAPSFCCSSSIKSSKPTMYSLSYNSSLNSCLKTLNFSLRISQMSSCHFTPWNGLRHVGISISPKPQKIGRREKCKGVVYASLFGVGAPEALVIGVVALLVFGPKGLAELARNLGKTLRAFQPTIRELQEVSKEFKNTLEREISLDDDSSSVQNKYASSRDNFSSSPSSSSQDSQNMAVADPNGASPNKAYSSEEYLKITEEQLKASAAAQQDVASSPPETQIETESQPQAAIQETATAAPPVPKPESET